MREDYSLSKFYTSKSIIIPFRDWLLILGGWIFKKESSGNKVKYKPIPDSFSKKGFAFNPLTGEISWYLQ